MLVDSHCHLDFADFAAERDAVIERARAAGVGTMVTICTRLDELPGVRAIADAYDDVWCSVGAHPHEAADHAGIGADELVALAAHPRVVGIGESGRSTWFSPSRSRQWCPAAPRKICGGSSAACRSPGCGSRPTRRIWPGCGIAAAATSRPLSRRPPQR